MLTHLQLLLVLCLSPRWASANLMSINMMQSNNWQIGMTLDDNFKVMPTPFTTDSMQQFVDAWDAATDQQAGTFAMSTKIASTVDEFLEALDVKTSLKVTSVLFSVDAHVNFARENTMCESDVAVIIRAIANGRKRQLDLADYNLLELEETAHETFDAWQGMYGRYIIVGFEYGGEILFQSTLSTKDKSDKKAIEAGLSVSFNVFGVKVEAGVDVNKTSLDTSKRLEQNSDFKIRPNEDSEEATELTKTLADIAMGRMAADEDLFKRFSASAKQVLSGEDTDPIKAIVVPLSTIKAVHKLFIDNPDFTKTATFMEFMNEIYLTVVGQRKQVRLVSVKWDEVEPESFKEYEDVIFDWDHRLKKFEAEMNQIDNINVVIEKSKQYMDMMWDADWRADVMSASSFLEISRKGLTMQFEDAVMQPFWDMLGNHKTTYFPTTAAPTTATPTTAEPTTPEPTADPTYGIMAINKGDCANNCEGRLGKCEGNCASDAECAGDLRCWHRNSWDDPLPPGCTGLPHAEEHDYCYDTQAGVVAHKRPSVCGNDYTWCADEWVSWPSQHGICKNPFSDSRAVQYGDGITVRWVTLGPGQSIECSNAAFGGDPVPGRSKTCFIYDLSQQCGECEGDCQHADIRCAGDLKCWKRERPWNYLIIGDPALPPGCTGQPQDPEAGWHISLTDYCYDPNKAPAAKVVPGNELEGVEPDEPKVFVVHFSTVSWSWLALCVVVVVALNLCRMAYVRRNRNRNRRKPKYAAVRCDSELDDATDNEAKPMVMNVDGAADAL